MKKIFALFLFFIFGIANAQDSTINKIIFFGDSLTDNGNLYSLLLHVIPKSPPYFKGRFSNGPTWAEHTAQYLKLNHEVYAYGGATAVFHMPSSRFISPTLLEIEVNSYLFDKLFKRKDQSLFSIWIGGNDYLFGATKNMETDTQKVVNKISWAVKKLIKAGGKSFLVLNLPDLGAIPEVQNDRMKAKLHAMTIMHNLKLSAAIQTIQNSHPDVHITYVDMFTVFSDAMSNPDIFNKKYNVNIRNTQEACWKGGYLFRSVMSKYALEKDINQTLIASQNQNNDVDVQAISQWIQDMPELAHAYQLGKSYEFGNVPCANPSEYLFWDSIHPSAVAHEVLAKIIVEKLQVS